MVKHFSKIMTQTVSPSVKLKEERVLRKPLYACTHVCKQVFLGQGRSRSLLAGNRFSPLLAVLPLSSRIHCYHLVVGVPSHGLIKTDRSNLHTGVRKFLLDKCLQEHTSLRETWKDALCYLASTKEKTKQGKGSRGGCCLWKLPWCQDRVSLHLHPS